MSTTQKIKYVNFLPLILKNKESGARLKWGYRQGYPRITVEPEPTKDGERYSEGLIIAPLTEPMLYYLLDIMNEIANSTEEIQYIIECLNTKFVDNIKTNEVEVQSRIILGRDREGIRYISVTSDGKKKVRFDLLPDTKWHRIYKNGEAISNLNELSRGFTKCYIAGIKKCFSTYFSEENTYIGYSNQPAQNNK